MTAAFVRQLGYQTGVQLNPLKSADGGIATGNQDQVFAIPARLTRGRIDKPFTVNAGNFKRLCGSGEPIRQNALNEAYIHIFEALNNGAYEAVVYRLNVAAASLKWIVATQDGTGAITYSVSADLPTVPYMLAVKHNECFNEGIKIAIHADKLPSDAANSKITLKLLDASSNTLDEFEASLDPLAKDDYGQSAFLGDVVERFTDLVEVSVGSQSSLAATSPAYGLDVNGFYAFATSDVMQYFTEGGTGYSVDDYVRMRTALQHTPSDYAYISAGGSQSPALIAQLKQLTFDTNRQLRFDVPGSYTVDAAQAFVEQLNFDDALVSAFYHPAKCDDPTGINGKIHLGTATLNIAYSCLRNAAVNAKGFAPKQAAVGGVDYPIERTGTVQTRDVTEFEKSDLAKAKINLVAYERYNGGGKFVFTDWLTMAKTEVDAKKLTSVMDMSTSIDDLVTRQVKEFLAKPMKEAIRMTENFLKELFSASQASGWVKPSSDLGGRAYAYVIQPNERRPLDLMDVAYTLHYEGALRQIHVSQTHARPR